MKNYEKYAETIKEHHRDGNLCKEFLKSKVLHPLGYGCHNTTCDRCNLLTTLWLMEDYKEPEVDWSKVAVDTPIWVKDDESSEWLGAHFAKYEDGKVYVWNLGKTSWTAKNAYAWKYAKLAEMETIKAFECQTETNEENGALTLPESMCNKISTVIEQMAETKSEKGGAE